MERLNSVKRTSDSQRYRLENDQAKSKAVAGSRRYHAAVNGRDGRRQAKMRLSLRPDIVSGRCESDPPEATGTTRVLLRRKMLRRTRVKSDIW